MKCDCPIRNRKKQGFALQLIDAFSARNMPNFLAAVKHPIGYLQFFLLAIANLAVFQSG